MAGTNFLIKENTAIIIPVVALHRDAKYFPDPMKFNPDRFFSQENNIIPFTYLPFGDGPRNCIGKIYQLIFFRFFINKIKFFLGLRMGKILTKVGLSVMLSKYKYELGPDTKTELKLSSTSFVMASAGGIHLKITRA